MTFSPPSEAALHLFCDTNLFLQCLPLAQLDWSAWQALDVVDVIVSYPVLREIDGLKHKGNDRQAKRARDANSKLRSMLPAGVEVVRESGPKVTLRVKPDLRYDDELADQLNFDERDDQIIGIAHEFAKTHHPVCLLTDDTSPQYLAQRVGLPVEPIPEHWLLPPESDPRDKKITALQQEIKLLRENAPAVQVKFHNDHGQETQRYETTFDVFAALTSGELANLVDLLKERHPIATEFGAREPSKRAGPGGSMFDIRATIETYKPPAEAEISEYLETAYPEWLVECERFLSTCHEYFQLCNGPPRFSFLLQNHGTRPAKDCLVTVEAQGDLLIKPPPEETGDDQDSNQAPTLPKPPTPPRGHWTSSRPLRATVVANHDSLAERIGELFQPSAPKSQHPNHFYYEHSTLDEPASSFSLACAQWRHRDGWEPFEGELYFRGEFKDTNGALVLRVHAENLPVPIETVVPVRIKVRPRSAFEAARELVERL